MTTQPAPADYEAAAAILRWLSPADLTQTDYMELKARMAYDIANNRELKSDPMTTQSDATQAAIESIGRDYTTLAEMSIELAKLKAELDALQEHKRAADMEIVRLDGKLIDMTDERNAARADARHLYDALLMVRTKLETASPGNSRDDKILEAIYPVIDAHAAAYPPKPVTP